MLSQEFKGICIGYQDMLKELKTLRLVNVNSELMAIFRETRPWAGSL